MYLRTNPRKLFRPRGRTGLQLEYLENRVLLDADGLQYSIAPSPDELPLTKPPLAQTSGEVPYASDWLSLSLGDVGTGGIRPPETIVALTVMGELEPNDTPALANPVLGFGTGPGEEWSSNIVGTFGPASPLSLVPIPQAEDDGSISSANAVTIVGGQVQKGSGVIGDGPHGSGGSGTGDFDFYTVAVTKGQSLYVEVDTSGTPQPGALDPIIGIYDAATGTLLHHNDDGPFFAYGRFSGPGAGGTTEFDAVVTSFVAPFTGTIAIAVGAEEHPFDPRFALPTDPFDSSSGPGVFSEGPYNIYVGLDIADRDFYSVELDAGDILGVHLPGGPLAHLSIRDPSGMEMMGSVFNWGAQFPAASPLPKGPTPPTGPNAFAVAPVAGTYTIGVSDPYNFAANLLPGRAYQLEAQVFRPALAAEQVGTEQVIFVDFDGATLDRAKFGEPAGLVTLSPLSAFLGNWGLTPADENDVIDAILATLAENLDGDLAASGPNGDFEGSGHPGEFAVTILNSRDHADPFGSPHVSRLIIGGTTSELGILTIGIAESVDPGNFATEEDAVILLDFLSKPAPNVNSLNSITRDPSVDMVDLIGVGVGNIASHEAGHYLGALHQDQFFTVERIMDQGGNLPGSVGVGPDMIFGTADDVDVDFGPDSLVPDEGGTGLEDTAATLAFGLSTGTMPVPMDFGDAPDSLYPTLLAADGARHPLSELFLGEAIDAEADGQPDAEAMGDDLAGTTPDDEDGVTFTSPLIAGELATVDVTASIGGGVLNAWLDFNRNGSWADDGEQIFSDLGLNAGINQVSFPVPSTATLTMPTYARFRLASLGGLSFSGPAVDGEVEDYEVLIEGTDFGDAPDPGFPTLRASNGARHLQSLSGPILGANFDVEADGLPDVAAMGDDLDDLTDDEDGITFTSPIIAGLTTTISVELTNAPGLLNAWVDFDDDGSWSANEQIFRDVALVVGANPLAFDVPLAAVAVDQAFARFRVDTLGSLMPTGLALDGEVEDYAVEIQRIPAVVGRHVFYNDSAFDGHDPAPNEDDDQAIATDKQALLPGQPATFDNYTSYANGINGVMLDIRHLPNDGVDLTLADFDFHSGNDDQTGDWPVGPTPTVIAVRPHPTTADITRVTLIWPNDTSNKDSWVQVTMLANAHTGLGEPDIHYWGNAVAETGNVLGETSVDSGDISGTTNNFTNFLDPAGITNKFDFNRDKIVDVGDRTIAINSQTVFLSELQLITPTLPPAVPPTADIRAFAAAIDGLTTSTAREPIMAHRRKRISGELTDPRVQDPRRQLLVFF